MQIGIPSSCRANSRFLISLSLSILIIVSASTIGPAQSGRRLPKQKPSSETPSKADETQPEAAAPVEEKNKTRVVVVKHLPHMNSSAIYSDMVVQECVARLRQAPTLNVTQGKDMRRKDASDYARESEDTFVVFIQLDVETGDTEDPRVSIGPVPSSMLYVDYILFEAGTGKQKTAGHIYQHRRAPGGPLPGRVPTSTGDAEYRMRHAGRETADRVLDALQITLPRGK